MRLKPVTSSRAIRRDDGDARPPEPVKDYDGLSRATHQVKT